MTAHCHVLLAEDNATEIELAADIFEIAGWTFKVASTGADAVDAVKREDFDMVLMDFDLPKLTGAEATMIIRGWEKSKRRHPLPIIGITASAMPNQLQECRASGMDEVITKPYNIDTLLKMLERICESRSSVS